jgi:hypothetical protein
LCICIVQVHRVIKFSQSPWLADYINLNQRLRAASANEFEKEFFKLMNNSIYGKTCENLKKRTDIKLVLNEQKRKALIEKPHCLGFKIFGENLAAVEMRKIQLMINKPFYVGFSVLELSKLHMARFHYEYIVPKYGEKASLLFTDTDSLMYYIETDNVYEDFWADRDRFDFAAYPRVDPSKSEQHRMSKYFDATNNKVITINNSIYFKTL